MVSSTSTTTQQYDEAMGAGTAAKEFALFLAFAGENLLDVCSLAAKATEVRDSDAKATMTTQRNHARIMYSLRTRK